MKSKSTLLIASLLVFSCAHAQDQPRRDRDRDRDGIVNQPFDQVCKRDIQRLCRDKKDQEARQCLQENSDKLDSDCRDAIKSPRR
jgi:hypothetical protein